MSSPSSLPHQRTLLALATVALVVLVAACLYFARSVLIPVALAILLAFMLKPIVDRLERRGLRRTPSVIVVVVLAGLLLGGIGWLVTAQARSLAEDLPKYQQNLSRKIADLRGDGQGSFFSRVQAFFQQLTREIEQEETPPREPAGAEEPQPVRIVEDGRGSAFASVLSALQPLLAPLASAALMAALVVSMLVRREDLRNRLIRLIGHGRLTVTTKALDDAGQRVSRYLLMQFLINGGTGIIVGIVLFFLGVDYAFVWGFLAAVLSYVPYVGFAFAALFPIAMSLGSEGWVQPLCVIGLYVTLGLFSNEVLQPLLYGPRVGVSGPALLVMVAFWTWLWGPVGMILATPLTVCLVVLGKYVPYLSFFDVLLGDQPALEADVRYYQRLLARDQDEAAEVVEEKLRSAPKGPVYDAVLIPALTHAKRDLETDQLSEDDADFVVRATREIVEDLGIDQPAIAGSAEPKVNGQQALSQAEVQIVACPARDEADEVALLMFQQLLRPGPGTLEVSSADQLASEVLALVEAKKAAIVCIAALPPGGLAHTRLLCKRLRTRFPELKIVVGRWGLRGNLEKNREQLLAAGADHFGTTLEETRAQVAQLARLHPHLETPTKAAAAKSSSGRS